MIHKSAHFVIYKDRKGEWRWRLRAKNGRIVADSGEGYKRPSGAKAAAARVDGICFDAMGVTFVMVGK